MAPRFAALVLFALAACSRADRAPYETPAQAYRHWDDKFVAMTGLPLPWRPYPCAIERTERVGKESFKVIARRATEDCVYMMPPQRWRGLWRNNFEGSVFCPKARDDCTFRDAEPRIWLNAWPKYPPDQKLYRVEFIGRRTMYLGSYGHMELSDLEIIVDRMISREEAARPTPSRAETEQQWRMCVALELCRSPEELEALHGGKK